MAHQLIEMLAGPFEPEAYRDAYRERVLELIEAKREGRRPQPPKPRKRRPVADLDRALERSLSAGSRGA